MGAPTRVQTLNAVKGAFSVKWASDTEVGRATLRVSGNSGGAANDSFVEYGWPAKGTPQVTKDDVSRSSLDLILSGASSAGAFSDGATGGQYDPLPRVTIATHSSLAASFRQDQVSGVLSESDASETADVTFTGHLISDEAANDPFACYH